MGPTPSGDWLLKADGGGDGGCVQVSVGSRRLQILSAEDGCNAPHKWDEYREGPDRWVADSPESRGWSELTRATRAAAREGRRRGRDLAGTTHAGSIGHAPTGTVAKAGATPIPLYAGTRVTTARHVPLRSLAPAAEAQSSGRVSVARWKLDTVQTEAARRAWCWHANANANQLRPSAFFC